MNRGTVLARSIGCLCFAVGLHTAAGSPVLIGGSQDGIIYDVDPTTGLASNPRDTGLGQLTGLAFSPGGVLYGRTGGLAPEQDSLFTINRDTGSAQLVGAIGESSFDFGFDPTTSLLYGASPILGSSASRLHTVDPRTLAVDIIGSANGTAASAAINPSGDLYLLSTQGDVLREIDKTSGATLTSLPLSANLTGAGVTFADDRTLFIVDGGANATDAFYTFDISTGILTNVGPIGLDQGLTSLTIVPEPTSLVLLSCVFGLLLVTRTRRQRNQLWICATFLFAGGPMVFGQSGSSTASSGTGSETGLGDIATLVFNDSIHGNFVVAGTSTRVFGASAPRSDPVTIDVSGIPAGATIVRAFASWSYLTNSPGDLDEAAITINGDAIGGDLTGQASEDLCWDDENVTRVNTASYTFDITSIALTVGGNGVYTISGALDEPASDGLAEGITILVIYTHPDDPLRLINVYSGMTTTETQLVGLTAIANLEFLDGTLQSVPYIGCSAHFFTNALDGQFANGGFEDTFRINSLVADGFPGTFSTADPSRPDAWQGILGPAATDNMYDHANGDASQFMTPNDMLITFETEAIPFLGAGGDCIGHSFAAIAFTSPAFCQEVLAPGSPFDCNGNTKADVCDLFEGTSQDCNGNCIPDDCEQDCQPNGIADECELLAGDPNFIETPGSPFPSGSRPRSVLGTASAAGAVTIPLDFDQDGDADLVTANDGSDDVRVFLNDGSGGFTLGQTISLGAGSDPHAIAAGDFDNDGDLDLSVTGDNFPGDVRILLSNGGIGAGWLGFDDVNVASIAVQSAPKSILAADFDLDGDLDLAVANERSNSVSILANNGTGGFSPITQLQIAVPGRALEVAAADFDGDGRLDLCVATGGANFIAVILNAGGIDAGLTFVADTNLFMGFNSNPVTVVTADVNNDGLSDILSETNMNNQPRVATLMNLGNNAMGVWLGFDVRTLVCC